MAPLLDVRGLCTRFGEGPSAVDAVDDVSFQIQPGETFCLVGESGSGKSVTGLSLLGLLPAESASHPAGEAWFSSHRSGEAPVDLLSAGPEHLQRLRGSRIAMIFQEPMTALNPVFTIGEQLMEPLQLHLGLSEEEARPRALELLEQVHMPDPARRLQEYPHRLSGGQRQRVMIAMAMACEPELLIADEPTTALDVTIQAQILELMAELQRARNMALLFVTHDLAVVANIADRIAVMQRGRIVETGSRDQVFYRPQHAYTRQLLAALPANLTRQGAAPARRRDGEPLLSIRDLKVYFPVRRGLLQRHVDDVRAVDGVSLDIERGEVMALVGESGSGKSTLGRALLRLLPVTGGQVRYRGEDLLGLTNRQFKPYRRRLAVVFQDPQSSLNPRLTIEATLTEPMAVHGIGDSPVDRRRRAAAALERVGLEARMLRRFPHEFSGGQRQRIGIARALVLKPEFIVCDEVTSALDVSVQARVLALLDELRADFDLTYLFITHNIDVVRFFADRVAVMHQGRLVEQGPVTTVCATPGEDYTRRLLDAVPQFDVRSAAKSAPV